MDNESKPAPAPRREEVEKSKLCPDCQDPEQEGPCAHCEIGHLRAALRSSEDELRKKIKESNDNRMEFSAAKGAAISYRLRAEKAEAELAEAKKYAPFWKRAAKFFYSDVKKYDESYATIGAKHLEKLTAMLTRVVAAESRLSTLQAELNEAKGLCDETMKCGHIAANSQPTDEGPEACIVCHEISLLQAEREKERAVVKEDMCAQFERAMKKAGLPKNTRNRVSAWLFPLAALPPVKEDGR